MSYDAQKVTYQEVAIFDRPALFTECRIDRTTVPEGVYRYELRHGDADWGEPIELSRSLMVNFYGTVLTREPFQLPIDGWIPLESGSLSFQDGGCRTLAEFQEKYPASDKDVIDFYSVNEPALHALYFSRSEEQDKSAGCVGHLRGDFGSGKQFYTTWWPHQQDALNTPEFKADIDRTVNWLREQPGSPLRDFDSMKRYCNRYEQICAIKGALLPSCGFMAKTQRYVYMLRCTPVKGDYQFYIYCYQRKPFEKAQKEQQKNDRLAVKKRAEPERYDNSTEHETTEHERSEHHGSDLSDAGRLSGAEPADAADAGGTSGQVRGAASAVPDEAPQSALHQPENQRQADEASLGDRADRAEDGGTDRSADGTGRGRDGGAESNRSPALDGPDEQSPAQRGGTGAERSDLRLTTEEPTEAGSDELPAFSSAASPQPTVKELFAQYKQTVGDALMKDATFGNACRNSDRENAFLEGAEAIRRIVSESGDLRLAKLYYDMPAFHTRLHQELLGETYPKLAGGDSADRSGDYALLDRLRADCDYFLGAGGRSEKHLWAGSVYAQIKKMRELYDALPEKTEWLTAEAIDRYAAQMAAPYQVAAYHHIENGFDDMPHCVTS